MNLINLAWLEYKSAEHNKAVNENAALRADLQGHNQYMRYRKYINKNPGSNKKEFLKYDIFNNV